jgi:serine/threonine protein kinase
LVDEIKLILREVFFQAALLHTVSEISRILEVVIVGKKLLIIMEYAPYGNLHEYIRANKKGLSEP